MAEVKYWSDPAVTQGIGDQLQELLDESVRAAVADYVKDGLFNFLTGSGTDLQVFFMPDNPLDDIEHKVPLIEMLENELESHIPGNCTVPAIEYIAPADDGDAPRINILQAMIRAYYDNGGPDLKPYK